VVAVEKLSNSIQGPEGVRFRYRYDSLDACGEDALVLAAPCYFVEREPMLCCNLGGYVTRTPRGCSPAA
jgi:hypothetical protein